ncbi:MAG TPA: YqhG family protein [Bacillota bacterium]|nr:YqhG family protein [Bacillota bacterium]
MMNQTEIRRFVEGYFQAFESTFIEEHPAYFSVELPIEVDKDLGNRPFYWTYVEKIGLEPTPLKLTFIFDHEQVPSDVRGDYLKFGSRRLHQIFDSAKKHGRFIRLYEAQLESPGLGSRSSFPLVPWLCTNYRVEFICDQKRDLLLPLGINLLTGSISSNFYQKIGSLTLTPKLPDYSFTMQPIFGVESAISRVEGFIQDLLSKEDTVWAIQAQERLKEEKELVESFFGEEVLRQESTDEDEIERMQKRKSLLLEKETRLQELDWQFDPRIDVSIVNAGLFFLRTPVTD